MSIIPEYLLFSPPSPHWVLVMLIGISLVILGVDDAYIQEGYCSPSAYPPTLMPQFGSISGHYPPTNSMGRDIELLKLNQALDLEPLAIHSRVSPSDGVTVSPHSRLNFTIIKKRRVKHKVDGIWGLLL